jgi:hypothetical protein
MQDSLMHTSTFPAKRTQVFLSLRSGTKVYLIMRRIVRITSVVMLIVEVDSLGGGGGSTAPGECIIPANAVTVSVRLSATAAQLRRNLFIVVVLQK